MQTRKYMLAGLASLIMFLGFAAGNTSKDPVNNIEPGTPHHLTGKWLNGTFSMSNWWTYDGKKYIGNPYTRSVAFNFTENGEANFSSSSRHIRAIAAPKHLHTRKEG
jgi:hypothetical protein